MESVITQYSPYSTRYKSYRTHYIAHYITLHEVVFHRVLIKHSSFHIIHKTLQDSAAFMANSTLLKTTIHHSCHITFFHAHRQYIRGGILFPFMIYHIIAQCSTHNILYSFHHTHYIVSILQSCSNH